jgi:hypothetical protein
MVPLPIQHYGILLSEFIQIIVYLLLAGNLRGRGSYSVFMKAILHLETYHG